MGENKKRPAQPIVDSSSDTDDLLPHVSLTKKRCTEGPSDVDFHAIKDDISAIRKDMEFFYQIDKRMKIPIALYRQLSDAFKCNICQGDSGISKSAHYVQLKGLFLKPCVCMD